MRIGGGARITLPLSNQFPPHFKSQRADFAEFLAEQTEMRSQESVHNERLLSFDLFFLIGFFDFRVLMRHCQDEKQH